MPHQDLVQKKGNGRGKGWAFSGEVTGKVPLLNTQEIWDTIRPNLRIIGTEGVEF